MERAIRFKHTGDGEAEVTHVGEEVRRGISLDELSQMDLSDNLPNTPESRRARVALAEAVVRGPAEEGYESYLRSGKDWLTEEQRAQTTATTGGGYIVPASFAKAFLVSLKQVDPIFSVATPVPTTRGSAMSMPIDDDTNTATIVAENAASLSNVDVVFGNIAWSKASQWRSGMVCVSNELLQDTAFDIAAMLGKTFARRMARGIGAAMVAQLLTDTDSALIAAATGAVTLDEVLSLMGSLDAAFVNASSFCMAFATYVSLLKQKASTGGQYMVEAEVDAEGFPTLFGRRVYLSPSFPALGAANKVITFGDHTKMFFRQVVNSLAVKSFAERYAEYNQTAFESYWRVDFKLAKATNAPLPVRNIVCHGS